MDDVYGYFGWDVFFGRWRSDPHKKAGFQEQSHGDNEIPSGKLT
jgi:hypothetical protein